MRKLLIFTAIILGGILIVLYTKKTRKEGFGQTIGMIEPQRRQYNKCVDDCTRYHNSQFAGDTYKVDDPRDAKNPGTFAWTDYLCDRQCGISADAYRNAGLPDLTKQEFQRNTPSSNKKGCNLLEASEECYCRQEIKDWCADSICRYSKSSNPGGDLGCQKDCERIYGYQCNSGLSWSWKP